MFAKSCRILPVTIKNRILEILPHKLGPIGAQILGILHVAIVQPVILAKFRNNISINHRRRMNDPRHIKHSLFKRIEVVVVAEPDGNIIESIVECGIFMSGLPACPKIELARRKSFLMNE